MKDFETRSNYITETIYIKFLRRTGLGFSAWENKLLSFLPNLYTLHLPHPGSYFWFKSEIWFAYGNNWLKHKECFWKAECTKSGMCSSFHFLQGRNFLFFLHSIISELLFIPRTFLSVISFPIMSFALSFVTYLPRRSSVGVGHVKATQWTALKLQCTRTRAQTGLEVMCKFVKTTCLLWKARWPSFWTCLKSQLGSIHWGFYVSLCFVYLYI